SVGSPRALAATPWPRLPPTGPGCRPLAGAATRRPRLPSAGRGCHPLAPAATRWLGLPPAGRGCRPLLGCHPLWRVERHPRPSAEFIRPWHCPPIAVTDALSVAAFPGRPILVGWSVRREADPCHEGAN